MKAVLKFLIVLLILVIVFMLVGLFLPRSARIQTSTFINAPAEVVFSQVNILSNWEAWSPWKKLDSTMVLSYSDTKSGVGSEYSWESQKQGNGSLKIIESTPFTSVLTEISFSDQNPIKSELNITTQEDSSLNIVWSLDHEEMTYLERYFMILFKKQMERTLYNGLIDLKHICEELKYDRVSEVEETVMPVTHAFIVTDSALVHEFGPKMGELYGLIMAHLDYMKTEAVGYPFSIIEDFNPDGYSIFTCGIPIDEKVRGRGIVKYKFFPEGKAVKVIHWGKYGSQKPMLALDLYIEKNEMSKAGPLWEVYISDPGAEKDTAKWVTEVYFPVK